MDAGEIYEIPNELLKTLDCPICKEKYNNPKVIDCCHIFCEQCLENYVRQDTRNFPPCPVCRKAMRIPNKGIRAYPNQTFYANVIQCIERQTKIHFQCRCCGVTDIEVNLKNRCQVCKELVCNACVRDNKHHCRGSQASTVSKSDLNRRPSVCETHRREKNVFYCTSCRKPCCKSCRYSDHLNHDIQSLSTAATRCKKVMMDMQTELKQYRCETQDIINDVKIFMDEFQRKTEITKEQIKNEFNNIIRCINEKEATLLEELLRIKSVTKKRLEIEIEEMQIINTRASSLEVYSYNLVKYGSDSEALEFETKIADNWNKLKDEKLYRYGTGFELDIQFNLMQRAIELLECDIGVLKASQRLSPWPRRRKLEEVTQGSLDLRSERMAVQVKDASMQSYPIKRSEVFSKLVDPRFRFGASKICPVTGNTATAWLRVNLHERASSLGERISQQFGSKTNTAESIAEKAIQKVGFTVLELEVHGGTGTEPRQITMKNIPNTAKVRLALNENGHVHIALYPGSACMTEVQKRWSPKKQLREDEGIYVATVNEIWDTVYDGYLRKIDILDEVQDRSKLTFDITKQGYLAVHHPSVLKVSIYSPSGERRDIDYANIGVQILGVCEARDGGILVFSTPGGFISGDEYFVSGEQKSASFRVRSNLDTGILIPELQIKNACFDMKGNILLHYRKQEADQLAIVCVGAATEEFLCKPEMIHRVDQMAIMPHGHICLFDKTECVLMTFQYLQ